MSVVVFLYSKYSRGCEKLLEMMSVMDFRKICIDHDEVRKLVVGDQKKYNVQKVPCILVFFANGVMKKYEGIDAFDWVKETMQKMKYISDATSSPPSFGASHGPRDGPEQASRHQVAMDTTASVSASAIGTTDVPSRAEVSSRAEVPSRPAPHQLSTKLEPLFTLKQHSSPQEPIAVQPVGTTGKEDSSSASEISDIPDMRRAMDSAPLPIQKLPPSVSKTHEESDSGGNTNTNPMRGIKSDKQESIMSVAQQMQKQREKEDEVRNPNTV